MLLNPEGSLELNLWEDRRDFSSLPLKQFKYKRWDWAYEQGVDKSVRPILDKMFDLASDESGSYKWLVDYKVRDLKSGECGCPLDFWHLDVVENPWHDSKPDIHFLFSTEIGTEFITTPMSITEDDTSFKGVVERSEGFHVVQAVPNTISKYGRFNLHRGPRVTKDCRRMLLRLTLTEVIK